MLFNFTLRAPEFPPDFQWLNTAQALPLEKLRGQVVVLDFWTYCCINCIHILPDLKWIEEKYQNKPVVVIGVHSAKFKNEEKVENIQSAIDRYEIDHPVIVDQNHQIWDRYAVRAWPTFVVIDTEGNIKGHFSGEGHREELDKLIHTLIIEGRRRKSLAPQPIQLHRPRRNRLSTLSFPGKITINPESQELFISDSNHHRIVWAKLTDPTTAEVKGIIGSGKAGNHDGSFATAQFKQPQGMCLVGNHLYICDTENHLIRRADLTTQEIITVAGTGEQSQWGARGGLALETPLNSPWDISAAGMAKDKLYIAMAGAHQIWQYYPDEAVVEVYAGSGPENIVDGSLLQSQFAQPSGIAARGTDLFVADSEVSAIRQVNRFTQEVKTLVGHGLFTFGMQDGSFDDALMQHPLGLDADENTVYVADTYNHAIRTIDLKMGSVRTLIKRVGKQVCSIDDKDCAMLPLFEPNDVKKVGNFLYIADTNNHLIRVYDLVSKSLTDLKIKE